MTGAAIYPAHADVATPQPSPSKAASTQFIFDPPTGWRHIGAIGDGLGIWLHSGDPIYSQNVSAQATTISGDLADIVSKEIAYIQAQYDGVTMKPIEQTTICGKHPATYLTYTFDATNTKVIAEQIVTMYGSTAYSAKYNRAVDQQPDAAAQHSLRSLCGGNPPR
ncbi:MAG TPA: hypothetical protein VID19_10805 [Candidatus Eremiobacteraceae bacterium]|jgi:hypothetical protein